MKASTGVSVIAFFLVLAVASSLFQAIGNALVSQYGVYSTGTITYGLPWVKVSGYRYADSLGRTLQLKGVNLVSTETRTEADYDRMKSWGVTVVRFPVRWDWLEPKPNSYSLNYLGKLDHEIALAKNHGMYVILEMQQWHWSTVFTVQTSGSYFGNIGFGFPPWLCSKYPDTGAGYNQSVSDFWSSKGPNGTLASSSNPSQQSRFIAAWKVVASRYAGEPAIAAYDLFNEPPRGILNWTQHANVLYPFYGRLMTEIRKVDPKHILNYEPSNGYATYYARKIDQNNTSISVNFYSLRKVYQGDKVALKAAFDDLYSPILAWNIPFVVTEMGIERSMPNYKLWANDTLSIVSRYGLSWTWFVYGKSDLPDFCLLYSDGTEKTDITSTVRSYL